LSIFKESLWISC